MSIVPSGTVTFLFTDIEGSTRLAQHYPYQWETLRARHHAILYQAVQAHNGYVFQVIGDEFCVAFHTAIDAVRAAADAQRMFYTEPWDPAPIRVRMGIHSGTASIADASEKSSGYTGYIALARTARLMSAGHGGQVLVSLATEELVRDELPGEISLRDLGPRRLKDLNRPEQIFQLILPGLPVEFSPLKTMDVYHHNLRIQLTSFIGREKEMAEICQEVMEHRLVTLTGAGGAGKTRLSLHVAADLLDRFPSGVWFVELASLTNPDLIPQTILFALGLIDQPSLTALQLLSDYLREKKLLLVLDNCEHLIEEVAKLVASLLTSSGELKILATSREALGVAGEVSWYVPSLHLPDIQHLPPVEALSQYEAVSLFINRAALVQPHFTVTKENAPAIAQICYRLDGIPLAIELAAARVKVLDVEQINKRLDDCFSLLTGGSRASLPRHQTLRAAIDWSYDLLSETEKVLFRRVSIFAGGWTLEATEQVCRLEDDRFKVLDLLAHLVDKSLVVMDASKGEARYHMLETTRQYAREKLAASQEDEALRNHFLDWCLQLAENYDRERFGQGRLFWLHRLDSELDNLRSALEWSLGRGKPIGIQLANDLADYWKIKGYLSESFFWLGKAVEQTNTLVGTPVRAKALLNFGVILMEYRVNGKEAQSAWEESFETFRDLGDAYQVERAITQCLLGLALCLWDNDCKKGIALIEEAIQIFQKAGNKPRQGFALLDLQYIKRIVGDNETALVMAKEALELFRSCGDRYGIARSLFWIGTSYVYREEYGEARSFFEEALEEFEVFGDKFYIAVTKENLGEIYRGLYEYEKAEACYGECLALRQEIGEAPINFSLEYMNLGYTALYRGDDKLAVSFFKEALKLNREWGERKGALITCLEGFAAVAVVRGKAEEAALIYGAAQSPSNMSLADLSQRDISLSSVDRRELEHYQALCRARLGDALFEAVLEQGRRMTLDEAISLALEKCQLD